ncbi:carbohydrate ABC transporter substrate-binding protein (CUT1 family) [Lachnotalea glycerini]|uniref:Carbohydrate ABC transporter substrate-binding protein (CUT1 family) n=1 Tax=Lachnotalea glycerini TaxID=1763509 RepID=A0A318ET95_9FIRM|nr:extracellular solute-binding protein [Lachnotalea glycerini]PXV91212.1 carbohydrate ABC transporter substrate-binding protein (CUT1 family) [Lachnotalea glycerini]
MLRKIIHQCLLMTITICFTMNLFTGCSLKKDNATQETGVRNETLESNSTDSWELARTTPYEPYPEEVTYSIGLQVNASVTYPSGSDDNAENNGYTRLYKNKLNIQNKDVFEAVDGDDYDQKVSMAITSQEIPDIMNVDYKTLKELIANDMIEDLTECYNNCASDLMRDIYASNDNKSLDMATFDGKLYAIPITSISAGQEMLWLRGDWMDQLNLDEPKTIDDIEHILQEFVDKDPGNNGAGKTVGLVLNPDIYYGGYAQAYQANNIFTYYGACPKQWIEDKDGNAVYGSVQPQMKQGLQVLADWYKKGLIDQQVAIRATDDITALVTSGQCGALFCGWWAPYTLEASYTLNNEADWRAYIVPAGADGKVTMFAGDPNQHYKVVRKGYEHPELLVKAVNISLDYNQGTSCYTDTSDIAKEYLEYVNHAYGVDPIGGFDYYEAASLAYEHISEAIEGKRDSKNMIMYENTLFQSCQKYQEALDKGEKPESTDWLNYNARLVSSKLMHDTPVNVIQPVFFDQTDSMPLKWSSLEKLEKEAMLKILTNEKNIDYFDTFVDEWMKAGGEQITKEVNEAIK